MYFFRSMQSIQTFVTIQVYRHFFTSSIKSNISKQSRIMNKILRRNDQGKIQMDGYTLSEIPKKTISKHTHRRMTVLNKVFMKHITDFMCTGEIDLGLMNKSVEIHDVKVTQDFKLVNIYWSDNSLDTSDTEEILKRCAFQLRYELTQLHVIGRVPPIQFVRYKHIHAQNEVDRRLAIADYGEDYIPSVYPLATNCVVTFSNSVNTDEKSLESKNTDNSNSNFSVTLPIMRHDVFGLNHARIMSKIKASLNQAKQVHWKENNNQLNPTPTSESSSQSMPSFLTTEEQQEQFNNYLREKQRQRRLKRNNSRTNSNIIFDVTEDTEDDVDDDIDIDDTYIDTDDTDIESDEYVDKY